MALKRQYEMSSLFSMASMTDVIFLLLIFFMVTSTYVFPTALELSLPQSSQQTAIKPTTRLFVYPDSRYELQVADGDMEPTSVDALEQRLLQVKQSQADDQQLCIGMFADESVSYGEIVKILDIGSRLDIKMVLATKPVNEQ